MKGYVAILVVLAVILAALLLLSVSFQRTFQMETAEQFNRQQLLLARAEVASIQTYLAGIKDELLHITHTTSLFRAYRDVDFAVLSDVIFRNTGKIRKRIRFIDRNGNMLYTRGNLEIRSGDLPGVAALSKRLCPDNVLIQQDTKQYSLIAPACRSEAGIGAVAITIDIQDLAETFLGPITSGTRGYAWMMDGKGNLLYHPSQPGMVGRNLYRADASCFTCHRSFDVEKRILEGQAGVFGRYVAPTGEDKILAYATASIGEAQWIVAVSSPYSEVTLAIKRSMRVYTWIVILIFVATSGIAAALIAVNRKREQAEERARHERALEMMQAEKLAALDRLTSGITSEIGNPLTSVFSFVQVLVDMEEDEFKKETLDTIFLHMNRIQDILKQLTSFSQMPRLELRPWKVNSVVENTLSLIQYDKRVQEITIVRDLTPGLPEIITDGSQLSQAMVNLVLNAADAMPNGGTLTIRSRAREGMIVIDLQDTGSGIGKEHLDRIFDPFYTTKPQGTGMGLTVSRDIIRKLGGELSAESEPGKGTTFSIALPVDRPSGTENR
jgi:signal transduction histidine kinase